MKKLIKTNNRTWKLTIVAVLIVTFLCSNAAFTLPAHAATKFSVKATGVTLREGQKLTKAMAAKTVKVTKTGKKASYTVTQVGKTVTANKNGKYKLTIKVGTVKKSIAVKVNKIKKVYIKQCKVAGLVAGSKFSSSNFMKKTAVMAEYKKGSDKKLSTYTVSAAKTVKANSKGEFVVTVKYGKLKDKISIPVIKKCVTETPATAAPTTEPTVVPTTAPAVTAVPTQTTVPTAAPTVIPTTAPAVTAVPTTEPTQTTTVPTAAPTETVVPTTAPAVTAVPTTEPTAVPTTPAPTAAVTIAPTAVPTTLAPAPTKEVIYITVPVPVTPTPVPGVKEFTLTITSNGGNVKVNGRNTSGTEKLVAGTKVQLTATDSANYRFVRWTDKNTGKEISTSKTCEVTVNSDMSITAIFEQTYTLTVKRAGGKGKVTLAGESLDFYSNVATFTNVPGRYTVTAVSTDDYKFVSWTDSNGKVLSTEASVAISLVSDATVTANFAEAEKTVTVTYQHESGDIIASESVAFGEVLATPTTNVWRADKTFAGWKITGTVYYGAYTDSEFYANGTSLSEAIKSITAAKQDVVITSYYVANPIQTYTVSLNGGTIDGKASASVEYNTHVYVSANAAPEGKIFSYWEDDEGNVVSYYEDYDFLVTKDITLTAVYADEPVEVEPVVTLDNATVDEENYGISYSISCQIPGNYEKLEWGILISTKLSGDAITYDSGAKILKETIYADDLNVSNGGYDLTLSSSYFENHKTIEARAYAIIQNDEGTQIIYSTSTISITL